LVYEAMSLTLYQSTRCHVTKHLTFINIACRTSNLAQLDKL